jgi:hypothetical protein
MSGMFVVVKSVTGGGAKNCIIANGDWARLHR